MKFLITPILFILSFNVIGAPLDSLLLQLDKTIEDRNYFDSIKISNIEEIKKQNQLELHSTEDYFKYYYQLSKQYQTFNFDSAYQYSYKLIKSACKIQNQDKIAVAKIQFSSILISAGLFKAAMDTLLSTNIADVSNSAKAFYFKELSRGYFDMESFSQNSDYAQIYHQKGMAGFDSALMYLPKSSWEYYSLVAQKDFKLGNNDTAIAEFEHITKNDTLTNDQKAVQLMYLAFVYGIKGDTIKEISCLAKAAMADFKGAKKEGVALLYLANILYESGDIIRASKYINIALADSRFYGSNFRLWQVSNFLPLIKAEHIVTIEKQKRQLWNYALVITLLALLLGVSVAIILKQISQLKKSKKAVEKINKQLAVSNEELLLANRIKEEYIGYYFETSSQFIEKLDKFKLLVIKRLKKKQVGELLIDVDGINIHKEKSNLYFNFDKAFLKIFPGFVKQINKLLDDNEQIQLKDGQLLNTELRIFALIRLGINDAEKLSHILDYSVNTIYAYKSKMKNKAKNPEQFERNVMLITRYSIPGNK